MFQKMLSSIGIGSATVDTKLSKSYIGQGGMLEGIVEVYGGRVEQKIDDIYLKIMTHRIEERDDREVKVPVEIYRYQLFDSFVIEAGETKNFPFRFQIPYATPITKDKSDVWVSTGLDIENAIDPTDKDRIVVQPLPYVSEVFRTFESLGFRCREVENLKAPSYFQTNTGVVQEVEFIATHGRYRGKFDEVEVWFAPHSSNRVELLFQFDKRAKGVWGKVREMAHMDETFTRLTLTQQNVSNLPSILEDMFRRT